MRDIPLDNRQEEPCFTEPILPAMAQDSVPSMPEAPPPLPRAPVQDRPFTVAASQIGLRFFLDICSGVTRPLSTAVLKRNLPVLSFDIFNFFGLSLRRFVAFVPFLVKWHTEQLPHLAGSTAA